MLNTLGTTSATPVVTDSSGVTRPATTTSLSATATNMDSWNASFLQDPEQLRRLSLLYQYGADQIGAGQLLCVYPVPEKPQTSSQGTSAVGKTRYVRVPGVSGSGVSNLCARGGTTLTLVGDDPDPAFLYFPDCIICAVQNPPLEADLKTTLKNTKTIFKNSYLLDQELYSPNNTYVPVILNPALLPDSLSLGGFPPNTRQPDQHIDWLSVVKDGVDPVPADAKRIGGSGRYTVYIHPGTSEIRVPPERHFSEFVLAILEAVQQPAELQKVGAAPSPITQPAGGR